MAFSNMCHVLSHCSYVKYFNRAEQERHSIAEPKGRSMGVSAEVSFSVHDLNRLRASLLQVISCVAMMVCLYSYVCS